MQTRLNAHRKFRTARPQFSRKADPNVFLEDRQLLKSSNKCRLAAIFSPLEELGSIHTGQKCQVEQKNSGISKFRKKGQPREVNSNFWNEFAETFCSIQFWNFGRIEHTLESWNHEELRSVGCHVSKLAKTILPWWNLFCREWNWFYREWNWFCRIVKLIVPWWNWFCRGEIDFAVVKLILPSRNWFCRE